MGQPNPVSPVAPPIRHRSQGAPELGLSPEERGQQSRALGEKGHAFQRWRATLFGQVRQSGTRSVQARDESRTNGSRRALIEEPVQPGQEAGLLGDHLDLVVHDQDALAGRLLHGEQERLRGRGRSFCMQ